MRLARRQVGLSPLQSGDVTVVLQHETDRFVVGLPRDPEAGDRNSRSSLRPMFDFAFPTAALAQRCNDLASRNRIVGLQEFMDDLSNRLPPGPAIKALAARRPLENLAVQVMDDDVGQVQDLHEKVEFGAHRRSLLLRVVSHIPFSIGPSARPGGEGPFADYLAPHRACHHRSRLCAHGFIRRGVLEMQAFFR